MSRNKKRVKALLASGTQADLVKAMELCWSRRRQHMDLAELELEEIPAGLWPLMAKQAEHMSTLSLSGNKLTELPDEIGQLTGVRFLHLQDNKLTGLPQALARLIQINTINISKNRGIKTIPAVIFALPNLQNAYGVRGCTRGEWLRRLEGFLRRTQGLEGARRARMFDVYRADADNQKAPLSHLVESLVRKEPDLFAIASKALMARSAKAPLDETSEVVILGSVGFKRNELKAALTNKGIGYATSLTPKTTHVVVGSSPKKFEAIDEPGRVWTFLSESDAASMIQSQPQKPTDFANTEDRRASQHGQNVATLLMSGDEASQELGLGLLGDGALPQEVATGLFVVAKLSRNAKHRAKARKILKKRAPVSLQKAISDRGKLAYEGEKAERRTSANLRTLARLDKSVDWFAVARFIHKRTRYGLSYVMEAAPLELKLEVLRERLSKNNILDYNAVYTPGYRPDYENPYSYYSGIKVPDFLYELTELQGLDLSWCCFDTFPKGLSRLENLQALDLTGNMFTKLPDEIMDLKNLKVLKLSSNAFDGLPPQILKMPWLKTVEIRRNRAGGDSHTMAPVDIDAARKQMPGCSFTADT